MVRKIKLGLY